MTIKAVPNADAKVYAILQTVAAEPLTVNATTQEGVTVIVPAGSIPGEYVELNSDGGAPASTAVVIDPTTFAANNTVVA